MNANPENPVLQEKVKQARNAITAALHKSRVDELIRQGDSFHAKGEYDKAIGEYQKGLTLDPDNAVLSEKIQSARDAAAAALERQERDAAAGTLERQVGGLISQGDSYYAAGRYDQAIAEYQRALRLDPDNALLLVLAPAQKGALIHRFERSQSRHKGRHPNTTTLTGNCRKFPGR